FHHRANRAAGNESSAFWCRLQQDAARAELPDDLVGNRRTLQRHLDEALLRRLDPLLDRRRHFLRLADAEADHAVAVADHHQRTEAQVLATLDDFGDAVDRDDRVLDFKLRRVDLLAALVHHSHALELQTRFARGISDGLHAAVIEEPVPVEDDALDAFFDEALRDRSANRLGAGDVAAALFLLQRALHLRIDRRGGGNRAAGHIVDDLHVHVRDAAEHRQPRPRLASLHPLSNPVLDAVATILFRLDLHL